MRSASSNKLVGLTDMNPVFELCERVAEAQAVLHDHVECGKYSAAEVVGKLHNLFEEEDLLRAMHMVGYFPKNTPPPANL
jgi:hypothetical protein